MRSRNDTNVPDFILMGLTDSEDIHWVLFMLFLMIYLITILGYAGMILIIHMDLQFHTPMYFFLSHLSFLDLSYSTVITPKTLENLLTSNKYISFISCFIQMYFFVLLGATECYLLSSVACDCYVAICSPLHYLVVMSKKLCCTLVTVSYMIGLTDSLFSVLSMNSLQICKSKVVHHFFCDTTPILALSCTDTHVTEITIFFLSGSTSLMVSLITISVSYGSILSTVLKISSTSGKHKAFSTCASHLLGVIIYGTMIFTYLKPKKSYSLGKDKVASVFYTMVVPMLNPLIYSLRNKELKNALRVMQKRGLQAVEILNIQDCDPEHSSSSFLLDIG